MNDMPSIKEAQAALETLHRFLDGMSNIFDANQSIASKANGSDHVQTQPMKRSRKKRKPTWKTKVAAILDESETGMAPAEITDRWNALHGWTQGRSQLGNRIRSTLAFMKTEGLVVAKDGRYTLQKQHNLM